MSKKIWITWEDQRRNRELCGSFSIKLFEFKEIDKIKNLILKYFMGSLRTFNLLREEKPLIVFGQNPSIVLSLFLIFAKYYFHFRLIIDAHNAGLFPLGGRAKLLNFASRFIQSSADLTIVSNEILKQNVEMNGGRAFVLQDKIPELLPVNLKRLQGKYNILFICTYADDEPYQIVFQAAKRISRDIIIYVTGNFDKKEINPGDVPANVVLTGFLPENDYVAMLKSVDATIDLTNRENCLVCGAYESIAAGKPMILSKTRALMEYFNQGAVYVEHTTESITNGINEVIQRNNELSQKIRNLKKIRISEWLVKKNELEIVIRNLK